MGRNLQSIAEERGTQAQGSQGSELLLGWPGFHLQVLRGDHDRHPPRSDHPRPQDQMDVRRRAEAQGTSWTDCRRQEFSRSWQGSQVQPDQGRQQARQLAEEEQSQAEKEAMGCNSCQAPSCAKYFSRVQNIVLGAEIYF